MQVSTLSADPEAIQVVSFVSNSDSITIFARTSKPFGESPKCKVQSSGLHSNYVRQLTDLPWPGVSIRIQLHSRKFRCLNDFCEQKVFCERLPNGVVKWNRTQNSLLTSCFLLFLTLSHIPSGFCSPGWNAS
jgi:transposase